MDAKQKLPYGIVILKTNKICMISSLVRFLKREYRSIRDLLEKPTLYVRNMPKYPMILEIKAEKNLYFLLIIIFQGTLSMIPNFIELFVRNLNFLKCEYWIYLVQRNKSRICIYTIIYAKEVKELLKLISIIMFHGLNYRILFLKWDTNPLRILKQFLFGIPPPNIGIGGNLERIIVQVKRILPKTSQEKSKGEDKKQDIKNSKLVVVSYDGVYVDYIDVVRFMCKRCRFFKEISSLTENGGAGGI